MKRIRIENEEYASFLDEVQERMNSEKKSSQIMIMGDSNTRAGGHQYENWQKRAGRFGLEQANDRLLTLLQFCAINEMIVCSTQFLHKNKESNVCVPRLFQTRN